LQTEETAVGQEKKALEETAALAWLRQGQVKEQQLHLARQMPHSMDLAKQGLIHLAKLVQQLRWTVKQQQLHLPVQVQTDLRHLEQQGFRQQKDLQRSLNNSHQPLSRSLEPVSQHWPVADPQEEAQTLTEQQPAQHPGPAVPDTLKQHPRETQSLHVGCCS
jgi:hypothetical protein